MSEIRTNIVLRTRSDSIISSRPEVEELILLQKGTHPMSKLLLISLLVFILNLNVIAQDTPKKSDEPTPAKIPLKTREQAEKEFEEQLSGATLVGFFTTDGQNGDKPLKPDRYKLGQVRKMPGKEDQYLFSYELKGTPIPLLLTVKWAGTTPVIVLDELTIPGMGTFSSRVMFHGDRYAGTWQHGPVGGLMFGKVEKAEPKPQKPESKPKTE